MIEIWPKQPSMYDNVAHAVWKESKAFLFSSHGSIPRL